MVDYIILLAVDSKNLIIFNVNVLSLDQNFRILYRMFRILILSLEYIECSFRVHHEVYLAICMYDYLLNCLDKGWFRMKKFIDLFLDIYDQGQ